MEPTSRIEVINRVIDLDQKGSLKIYKKGNKYQLCLTVGIKAIEVLEGDDPNQDIKNRFTDALIEKELLIEGSSNVSLQKVGGTTKAPMITVAFKGPIDTKVPGTGDGRLALLEYDELDEETTERELSKNHQ